MGGGRDRVLGVKTHIEWEVGDECWYVEPVTLNVKKSTVLEDVSRSGNEYQIVQVEGYAFRHDADELYPTKAEAASAAVQFIESKMIQLHANMVESRQRYDDAVALRDALLGQDGPC